MARYETWALRLFAALGACLASGAPAAAAPADGVPVVVELFTSEGCSSCPRADALLAQLDRTQPVRGVQIIALELHVDYWNDLGWVDPFSDPAFSARQQVYSAALAARGVYTPQVVVNGEAELVGGDSGRLYEVVSSRRRTPPAAVELSRRSDGMLDVHVAVQGETGGRPEVWLAIAQGSLRTDVRRGENAGRTMVHGPVVRSLSRLGPVVGGRFSAATAARLPSLQRDMRAVILVQDAASRRMLGAAALRLD